MEVPNWTNDNGITLFCCDNIELMSRYPNQYFDLAIVDPPYGIGWENRLRIRDKVVKKSWDGSIPDNKYFDELFRVSKNQIIWGGNYFPLGPTKCFVFWYKHQPYHKFSAGELAWTSFNKPAKCFDYPYQLTNHLQKKHATEKPIALYDFLLHNFSEPGQKILDTHLGSGNIAISCNFFGVELIASEIDQIIFEDAIKNISDNTKQQRLFEEEKTKIIQTNIFDE